MHPVKDIIEGLSLYASEARAAKSVTMYPTSMKVLGVSNPDVKKVLKDVYTTIGHRGSEALIHLAFELVDERIIECQMLAYLLLEKAKVIEALRRDDLERLEGVMDNWVSVDTYGVTIYGVLWRLGVVRDEDVVALQQSEDVWKRRLALVATVALNLKSRGGRGDTFRTLMICDGAAEDHEDMVVKALSWALRSLIRWDRRAVEAWMELHRTVLHRRVNREVEHKLEHGTKN